jgi:dolichol-phosphate mannosyltransferase
MNLSIVVPCYNEVENIPKVKAELIPVVEALARTQPVELVFVDDGCTDGTLDALKALFVEACPVNVSIKYAIHPHNEGLGQAIRTGFANACGDVIVTTDSDGTYKFSSIPDLLACLRDDVDIVTASPYHPQGGVVGVPAYRLILSQGSSLIYRILVNGKVHTYTSLFRAYRRKVIVDVPFTSSGFLGGTELLVKSMLKGYRVAEYPAVLYSRVHGISKAKIKRTILAHLQFQASIVVNHYILRKWRK